MCLNYNARMLPITTIILENVAILPVVTNKDLPISLRFSPTTFYRDESSALLLCLVNQSMVEFYLLLLILLLTFSLSLSAVRRKPKYKHHIIGGKRDGLLKTERVDKIIARPLLATSYIYIYAFIHICFRKYRVTQQEDGHTGFFIHLPSAVRTLFFFARRIPHIGQLNSS